ncbi:MAG: N-acetylneuraminate synthase family protein [Elusimicrobia bacterium]|nr:N-acetylneuraminate synthase family protein [Elusimicrobiota bacterium]
MIDFNSEPLFILEMANNHMGDVEHGIRILREFHAVTKEFDFKFAFKLQRRDPSFIHPDYRDRMDMKYVKRFTETQLSEEHFKKLKDEMVRFGYIPINTPWDEKSVDLMEKFGFEIIKVASCSFIDWPLLERIAQSDLPIVASTAGAALEDIDKVAAFFQHRKKNFCLMHCIAAYPTSKRQLQLNQIDLLKRRYPAAPVGYSTHESPDNCDAVGIAIGKGAAVLERHVGVPTAKYPLNAYSSTPEQIRQWLLRAKEACEMCGVENARMEISADEKRDLIPLFRGAFASRDIAKGDKLSAADVFFALPNVSGQALARDFSKYTEFTAQTAIERNKPILFAELKVKHLREKVEKIITRLKETLRTARVFLPNQVDMEISSHLGIDRFEEHGAVLIRVFNREYCKMLLVMFPGQNYPSHRHKLKEETLHVLHGDLTIDIQGKKDELKTGDVITVERGAEHSFKTKNGVIIEEISTTYFKGDSYYADVEIGKRSDRKIELAYWIND